MNYHNQSQHQFGRGNSGNNSFAQSARLRPAAGYPAHPPVRQAGFHPAYGTARKGQTPGRTVNGARFISGIIDSIIIIVLIIAIMAVFAFIEVSVFGDNKAMKPIAISLGLAAAFFYGVFMESSALQGTVGKLVTNTIITDYQGERISFGRSFGRNAGKVLSACMPFYFPYFMVCFTDRNQTLHDMMAKTMVCKNLGDTHADTDLNRIFA